MENNFDLTHLNTFGIKAQADSYIEINNEWELEDLIESGQLKDKELLILGGGSNVLFTKDFGGLVLKNNIKGVEIEGQNQDFVYVQSGGGEVWHDFVLHCIDKGWYGIENLSLIPGSVGASPMQNIGAYGVEIKDVFYELEAIHLQSGETHHFTKDSCEFGYRESVFKKQLKNQYFITRVTFQLRKEPAFKVEYGAIKDELAKQGVKALSAKAISDAVIAIRSSKLPNPKELGNAGSFFKNPVITSEQYEEVKTNHPDVVAYPAGEGKMKLAAGWLIEHAGWKGKVVGHCGVHHLQALVLVNHGDAQGKEVFQLSEEIIASVKDTYGVQLEREVNIY